MRTRRSAVRFGEGRDGKDIEDGRGAEVEFRGSLAAATIAHSASEALPRDG
jgi:hypothetical protein